MKTDSPEALGPSDDESNSAFQRDGPGRISIKKGEYVCMYIQCVGEDVCMYVQCVGEDVCM